MRNIFNKKMKLISLGDYVTYLKKNQIKKFQLDIFRNNLTDLQIICNDLDYGIKEIKFDLSKIFIVLSLTEDLNNKEKCLKNLKYSNFKFLKIQSNEYNDRYLIEINRDWDLLYKTVNKILCEIYEYTTLDTCALVLIDFSNGNGIIVSNAEISYLEYFRR